MDDQLLTVALAGLYAPLLIVWFMLRDLRRRLDALSHDMRDATRRWT